MPTVLPQQCTLLIATYNWPEALNLVLKSVLAQSVLPLEVMIADDGSGPATRQLIEQYQAHFPIPLRHCWHADDGFRKTIILNQAIRESKGEYIVQIDGDIILHPHFIRDHLQHAEEGYYIKGSRGRLTEKRSKQVLATGNIAIHSFQRGIQSSINATHWPVFSKLFYGKPEHSRNVKGCNFAVWKADFIKVNGYNNAMHGWGHEDIELAARLVNAGVKHRQLKMSAVCFHIYHPLLSRHSEDGNFLIYQQVVSQRIVRCEEGYNQTTAV